MKTKLLILLAILLALSCSKENEDDLYANCSFEVTGLGQSCVNGNCIYSITTTGTNGMETTTETNKTTFNFYTIIVQDELVEDCYEGEK